MQYSLNVKIRVNFIKSNKQEQFWNPHQDELMIKLSLVARFGARSFAYAGVRFICKNMSHFVKIWGKQCLKINFHISVRECCTWCLSSCPEQISVLKLSRELLLGLSTVKLLPVTTLDKYYRSANIISSLDNFYSSLWVKLIQPCALNIISSQDI